MLDFWTFGPRDRQGHCRRVEVSFKVAFASLPRQFVDGLFFVVDLHPEI